MSYQKGVPQYPLLVFSDGAAFEVLLTQNTIKDRKPAKRFTLAPFDWTMTMLKIEEKDLDFSVYSYGTLERTYPACWIETLSDNPEKPIMFCFLTFDGNVPDMKSEAFANIFNLKFREERLIERVSILEAENKRLMKENFSYSIKMRQFLETTRGMSGEPSMLPVEQQGAGEFEIKRKVQAGGAQQ